MVRSTPTTPPGSRAPTSPHRWRSLPSGPAVNAATQALIATAKAKILAGTSPYTGPITDQSGTVRIAAGATATATATQLSSLCYLVKGVVGTVPAC